MTHYVRHSYLLFYTYDVSDQAWNYINSYKQTVLRLLFYFLLDPLKRGGKESKLDFMSPDSVLNSLTFKVTVYFFSLYILFMFAIQKSSFSSVEDLHSTFN